MTDNLSPAKRSQNMAAIKCKNTQPELIVRRMLHKAGFRYRLHNRELPGKPDMVLKKYNTVIFVNGCFWHQHKNCKYAYTPKSNLTFWKKKFELNIANDNKNHQELQELGWKVIVVWECEIKHSNVWKESLVRKLTG